MCATREGALPCCTLLQSLHGCIFSARPGLPVLAACYAMHCPTFPWLLFDQLNLTQPRSTVSMPPAGVGQLSAALEWWMACARTGAQLLDVAWARIHVAAASPGSHCSSRVASCKNSGSRSRGGGSNSRGCLSQLYDAVAMYMWLRGCQLVMSGPAVSWAEIWSPAPPSLCFSPHIPIQTTHCLKLDPLPSPTHTLLRSNFFYYQPCLPPTCPPAQACTFPAIQLCQSDCKLKRRAGRQAGNQASCLATADAMAQSVPVPTCFHG